MAEGVKGTIDWVGYGVGVPVIRPAGFVGLLDFTGIPVGTPGAGPGPVDNASFYHRRYRRISYR